MSGMASNGLLQRVEAGIYTMAARDNGRQIVLNDLYRTPLEAGYTTLFGIFSLDIGGRICRVYAECTNMYSPARREDMPGQITKIDMVGPSDHTRVMDCESATYVYIEGEAEPRKYPDGTMGYIIELLEEDSFDCSVLRKALDEWNARRSG
jgi:hypothetical protein